ncbi:MAG TPA: aminotransferase class V-fold PLP-dependent enzyme [Vicinamibacterales bacterium]|jgi:glutamate/tyrosine decarboxylase-like PLP-dependent enzyme
MSHAYEPLLTRAHERALAYLQTLSSRPVRAAAAFETIASRLGGELPNGPDEDERALTEVAAELERGLVASPGPRYFGFVTGGSYPAALAADWLVSAWDQNAMLLATSPAMSALEACAARWVLQALELPPASSVGFVTGAHMANVTALAAARHEVLHRARWDVEAMGLQGAPPLTVIAGEEAHSSVFAACRLIGFGSRTVIRVATDSQGRMRPDALEWALSASSGPTIVCAQAGNVNTGACDPLVEIVELARERQAWVHVDGAFGLWAASSPRYRNLVAGLDAADSWATDAHKWLNVPYDSGIVIVRHPAAHRAAMSQAAAYLIPAEREQRDDSDWVPESSRRARALPIYIVLRTLGRSGLAALVDRCCALARRMADALRHTSGIQILNDVGLNQVLVRFLSPSGENISDDVIAGVQEAGVCWCGGTSWSGSSAMRISISNWQTTEEDVDRSAASIIESFLHASSPLR